MMMKKILLHEPDPGIFEIMTIFLKEEGYSLQRIPDYLSVNFKVELVKLEADLILLDYFSQHTQSRKILAAIQSLDLKINLVALSCDPDIADKYHNLGFHDFIKKPFDLDMLTKIVSRNLGQPLSIRSKYSRVLSPAIMV